MPRLLLNREHNDETSFPCQLVTWSCKAASVASVTCDLCCSSLMQLVGTRCFSFVTLTDSMKVIKGRMGGQIRGAFFFSMSTLGSSNHVIVSRRCLSSCVQSGGAGPQISVVRSETEHTQVMGGVGVVHLSVIVTLWICFSQMWQLGTPDTPGVCHRQHCFYKHKNTQTEVQTREKERGRRNRAVLQVCFTRSQ